MIASKSNNYIILYFAIIRAYVNYRSDSDGNPILTQAELGKLMRNSAKARAQHQHNPHHSAAATRNLYNRQQPLQYAQTHQRRNYGSADLSGYNPVMGAASNGRGSNSDANDDDSSSFGPNFDTNEDEGSNSDGGNEDVRLNQAASGYPAQGDYNNDAGFGFGGASGYGPSMTEGSEFGPSDSYGGDGRRAKSASSPMNSRNYGLDDDAGAPQYGPNSAINSGERDVDDDGRSGYGPDSNDDNDDE